MVNRVKVVLYYMSNLVAIGQTIWGPIKFGRRWPGLYAPRMVRD